MEYVGIDVPKKQSQICPCTAAGEVLHQRLDTHRERCTAVFAERPKGRILRDALVRSRMRWIRVVRAL